MTTEYKCAFNMTLMGDQFGCKCAQHVTRRNGPDVACTAETAHLRCGALMEHLKQAALPAFGVDDDPLTMPHSILVKIGFGGLLGVQRLVDPAAGDAMTVADVDGLLERAQEAFGAVDAIPCTSLIDDMTGYKLTRRRSR